MKEIFSRIWSRKRFSIITMTNAFQSFHFFQCEKHFPDESIYGMINVVFAYIPLAAIIQGKIFIFVVSVQFYLIFKILSFVVTAEYLNGCTPGSRWPPFRDRCFSKICRCSNTLLWPISCGPTRTSNKSSSVPFFCRNFFRWLRN